MRILSFSLKITLLALMPLLCMNSCKDDDAKPDTAKISGTITIENAQIWEMWKDSGEVQLTIFPKFVAAVPPAGAGWGEVPDGFFGPGVPGGRFALGAPVNAQNPIILEYQPGVTQYNYSITLDPGEYSALALGFRHDNIIDPTKRTATLGVHFGNPNEVSHGIVIRPAIGAPNIFNEPAPSTIILEKGDDVTINFRADFGIIPLWYQ
jgi:hypothetical protein